MSWSIWKPDEFSDVTGGLQLVESQEKACFDVKCMRPQKLLRCLSLISFFFFCLAFACLFYHLWCYFSSNEFLPLYCFFFPLALFEFESLLVLKIPFSVRLGFLIHLKFLISEYLSHFCSDNLFCNEMSVKKKPNSCLFFFFSCFKTCTGLVFVKHRDHGPSGGRFSKVHEFLPFQKRLENPIFLWYLLIFKHWLEFK